MSADEASLYALTDLLSEFYSPSITSERRIAIQQVLMSFEQIPNAWYLSSYYLFSTTNSCVALYCLGVIDNVVVRRWAQLIPDERLQIRQILQTYLFDKVTIDDPHYLIKKAAKILACIACFDWPHDFPTYMEDIKRFISNHLQLIDLSRLSIGLFILRVSVEQCLDTDDLVTHQRKLALRKQLVDQSVSVYAILFHIASHLCGSDLLNITYMLLRAYTVSSVDPTQSTVWHSIFRLTKSLSTALSNQSSQECMAFLAWLECFNQVIRIFPIDDTFYSPLYVCSLIGSPAFLSACDVQNLPSNPTTYLTRIGLCALSCMQEIVERTDLDQNILLNQLTYIFPLIQSHVDLLTGHLLVPYSDQVTNTRMTSDPKILNADISSVVAVSVQTEINCSDYRSKLTDILKLLMSNFFYRISHLAYSQIPINEGVNNASSGFKPVTFLGSFHDFTFSSPEFDNYLSCLDIWTTHFEFFLIRYQHNVQQPVSIPPSLSSDLFTVFITFGRTLLYRLFYSNAASFLETLETESDDALCMLQDDVEEQQIKIIFTLHPSPPRLSPTDLCESRANLRESLITLSAVISLVPDEMVHLVLEQYHNAWNDFVTFARNSDALTSNHFIIPPKHQPLHRVHWLLRDYATSLQIVGFLFDHPKFTVLRVNNHSVRDNDRVGCSESALEFLNSLVYGLQISHHMVQNLESIDELLIRHDLIAVMMQNLLILHALLLGNHLTCSAFGSESGDNSKLTLSTEQAESFITEVLTVSYSILTQQSKDFVIVHSCAVRLFDSLCTSSFSSPFLTACLLSSVIANTDHKQSIDRIRSIVYQLFDYLCSPNQRVLLEPYTLRHLMRTMFRYLSIDPPSCFVQLVHSADLKSELKEIKHSKLKHLISASFCPTLNVQHISENPETHLTCLGFLYYALSGLLNTSGNSRRLVSAVFQECGILNSLLDCVTKALHFSSTDESSSSIRLKFCTAYLTFFTAYIRLVSLAGSTLTGNVQDLLVRLIKEIVNTNTHRFPIPLHDCLVDIVLSLSESRRNFVPLIEDLLNLSHYHLLSSLSVSYPPKMTEVDWEKLLCEAAHTNGPSVQKLFKLLFVILLDGFSYFFSSNKSSNNGLFHYDLIKPQAFHQNLLILASTFDASQTNSDLVKFVLNQLKGINFARKLYYSPDFQHHWLPKIVPQLFTLLVNKQHNSCRDELIECLHQLLLSILPHHDLSQNGLRHPFNCDAYLSHLHRFLSLYLDSQQPTLDLQHRSNLISAFLSHVSASKCMDESNPIDLVTFTHGLEQFIIDLRHHSMRGLTTELLASSS